MYKLFDAHSDLFEDVDEKRQRGLTDIIRGNHMQKWAAGGYSGGFCPVWVDPFCEVYSMPVTEQFDRISRHMNEELEQCGDICVAVTDLSEYEAVVSAGKAAIFLGTEGLSFLHGDWGALEGLYALGMREFSLTWNETNEFAGGAATFDGAGLTSAGKKCVKKIHELGAILDLAHASSRTFYDAVSLTDGPFMVSHGNMMSLCEHPRNLTDDQLRVIADNGGVAGISVCPSFVDKDPARRSVARVCDHIEHAVDKMGIDHVGLGLDLVDFLDDYGTDPSISEDITGIESVSCAQNIAAELERRGFGPGPVSQIFSGNFLRLIGAILQ